MTIVASIVCQVCFFFFSFCSNYYFAVNRKLYNMYKRIVQASCCAPVSGSLGGAQQRQRRPPIYNILIKKLIPTIIVIPLCAYLLLVLESIF